MPPRPRRYYPLLIALGLVLLAVVAVVLLRVRPWEPGPTPHLADLATAPDWTELERYHGVLSRAEFETALSDFYTLDRSWKDYFLVDDRSVVVLSQTGNPTPIAFAGPGPGSPPPRPWRPAAELPPAPPGKPLDGLRIAIDPGHIGGQFARLEERWYQIDHLRPVAEGDMTLVTARLLKPRLEELGANVFLVRDQAAPVTTARPRDFLAHARRKLRGAPDDEVRKLADRLFYRTAEIRARARLVNRDGPFRPDLVLCLHFNAERWGDPGEPRFSPRILESASRNLANIGTSISVNGGSPVISRQRRIASRYRSRDFGSQSPSRLGRYHSSKNRERASCSGSSQSGRCFFSVHRSTASAC